MQATANRYHTEDTTDQCDHCGYPRRGLTRGDCPECGGLFDPPPLDPAERQRQRTRALRMVGVIVAIQLLLSLFPFVLVWIWLRS